MNAAVLNEYAIWSKSSKNSRWKLVKSYFTVLCLFHFRLGEAFLPPNRPNPWGRGSIVLDFLLKISPNFYFRSCEFIYAMTKIYLSRFFFLHFESHAVQRIFGNQKKKKCPLFVRIRFPHEIPRYLKVWQKKSWKNGAITAIREGLYTIKERAKEKAYFASERPKISLFGFNW